MPLFIDKDETPPLSSARPTWAASMLGLLAGAAGAAVVIALIFPLPGVLPIALLVTTSVAATAGVAVAVIVRLTTGHRDLIINLGGFGCGSAVPVIFSASSVRHASAFSLWDVDGFLFIVVMPDLLGIAATWFAVGIAACLSASDAVVRRPRRHLVGWAIFASYTIAGAMGTFLALRR